MWAQGLGVTELKKQIGNSVPPAFGRGFFEGIKRQLLKTDGILGPEEDGVGARVGGFREGSLRSGSPKRGRKRPSVCEID